MWNKKVNPLKTYVMIGMPLTHKYNQKSYKHIQKEERFTSHVITQALNNTNNVQYNVQWLLRVLEQMLVCEQQG